MSSNRKRKTYTEREVRALILQSLTISKLRDAASLAFYASRTEAAQQILKDAAISMDELIRYKHHLNEGDYERLRPLL